MGYLLAILAVSTSALVASPAPCSDATLLEKGFKERDLFEQLRQVPVIDLGRGRFMVNGDLWDFDEAQAHYLAAMQVFHSAIEGGTSPKCAYRELIRLFLYNRYHVMKHPIARDIDAALMVSLSYRTEHPGDPWAWLLRGLVLHLDGQIEAAGSQFERASGLMTGEEVSGFTRSLPTGLSDPFLSTSVNEAETAVWARAVYADIFYPGWRSATDSGKVSPGQYIVSFGIPEQVEYRIRPYNSFRGAPRPGELVIHSGGERITFEDPWRSRDWDVVVRDEVEAADRLRVEEFQFVDRRNEIGIYHSYARFREPGGSTRVAHTFGLPFQASMPPGTVSGGLRLGTLILDDDGSVLESVLGEVEQIETEQMWQVDTLRVWTQTHIVSLGDSQTIVASEAISRSWTAKSKETLHPLKREGLAVSDVVLAHAVFDERVDERFQNPGSIIRHGYTITPNSTQIIERGAPAHVYFEVYDASLDSLGTGVYDIQVNVTPVTRRGVIRRLFQGPAKGVGVRLQWESRSGSDSIHLAIDTGSVAKGPALLTVAIKDRATGETASTERRVEVR